MSLTPCKFFAQGNCRYGNNCRFYHETRNQGQTGIFGNRTLAPPTFQPSVSTGFNQGGALNLSAKSNQNLDIIVEGVKKDMQEWQTCKIWPYSCYGPVGAKPCIPGFEDVSPEEFRLAFMQHGNMVPPELNQRFQQIQQLRINWQQPTVENRTLIERIATSTNTTPPATVFGGQGMSVQPQQTAGIFGGSSNANNQASSIFGGNGNVGFTPQQPLANNSIFGSLGTGPTQPTFGQPATVSNVFQSPPAGIFAGQSQSVFGGSSTQQQPASVFQSPQSQQPSGMFQNSGSAVAPQGSFFQQASPQSQGNVFQQTGQPQSGLFQQPVQQQSTAGLFQLGQPQQQQINQANPSMFNPQPQQQPSLFAPAASNSNIFGGNLSIQQPATAPITQSIFGGATSSLPLSISHQQPQAVPQAVGINQKFIYSNESDLTPAELEAFKAGEFTVDSLPTKVPPQSLCL